MMHPSDNTIAISKLLPNITNPYGKVVGAALNYKMNQEASPLKEPIFFLKPTTSIVEEGAKIKIPSCWTHVHTEVEVGVIIGKCINRPLNSDEDVSSYIAGYHLTLDLANMDMQAQLRKQQFPWFIPKSFDTSTPISKTIVTDSCWIDNVDLELLLNNKTIHKGNTNNLIFSIPDQIRYLSKYMTLVPGDLILSGTPPGSSPITHNDELVATMKNVKDEQIQMKFKVQ